MSTHSATVRKWPHVDCCIATTVNLHGYCSEEVALCWFVIFHTLILLFLFLVVACLLGTGNLDGSWHYSVGTALYL